MTDKEATILNTEDLFKDKYIIPLYQRNFAWGEEQIARLLQDIYESMRAGEEHFYIGSLIVLQRGNGEFEVIDGQQRLTMLALLACMLDMGTALNLHYDSRPEVEEFFHNLNNGMMPKNRQESAIAHFIEAMDIARETQLDVEQSDPITIKEDRVKHDMAAFIKHHVCLVREIMPADTDVAAYFEIMNNRGEQLQEHEIVKGLLLGMLHAEGNDQYATICSRIWDACSQMEKRVQKSFDKDSRRILFGDNCDALCLTGKPCEDHYGAVNQGLLEQLKSGSTIVEPLTLDEIVSMDIAVKPAAKTADDGEAEAKEESIIDFPNFLMHVFRLYYNAAYRASFHDEEAKDIPLNEKYLLKVFNTIKKAIRPLDLFLRLLHTRVIFDRYVIKNDVTDDDKREWALLKPYIYVDEARGREMLRFRQTFNGPDQKQTQEAIVRAQSCLQVSFRTRIYKNFLQTILTWFSDGGFLIDAATYLQRLHHLMLEEFDRTSTDYVDLTAYDADRQGTSVPHYLFNFTDYLYWWMKDRGCAPDWNDTDPALRQAINDELALIQSTGFSFLYRNSVEHHYPQKRQEERRDENVDDFHLNCLGNLVLISKSANSRLSDKNPLDKANLYARRQDLPPTRQIIYAITIRNNGWGLQQIDAHLHCMEAIIAHRKELLG